MSAAATAERTAKERVRRTRSRGRNELAPLRVSQIPVHEYDLDPACISLVCPSCRTWVPINRPNGQPGRTRLVPHHTERAGTADPAFCKGGSHRRVIIDVDVERWRRRLQEGVPETDGRRSARQHYKPLPAPTKPVTKMTPEPMSADDALTAYREHLKQCRKSSAAGRCGGTHRCADGARLAALYEQLHRTQAHRDREQKAEVRVDGLLTRYRQATATKTAAAEWAKRGKVTSDTKRDTAKRGGTTVEEANNTCRIHPADTVSEFRGPQLPLAPQDAEAHDRRQAELGKRYARKTPTTSAA